MSPGAVAHAVRGGIGRRRGVQTIVIAAVLLVSTASSVLGLALVVDSRATFDHAFAAQHGAQLVATVDTSHATAAELTASARRPQVTAANGPFPDANVSAYDSPSGSQVFTMPPLTLAGRLTPGGPVDDITLQAGHWPTRTGQIVLENDSNQFFANLGDTVVVTSAPGKPRLKVVGLANSVSRSADGWVVPAEIPTLRGPHAPATSEMLYRFRSAGTPAEVRTDARAVASVLPVGSVIGKQSYLSVRTAQRNKVAVYAPFVVAFAIIGLIMSVLIVANVVSGAVIAGYYRIGILKSLGFSPGQVVAAYTAQASVPAVCGCIGGVVLGNLLSVPLLRKTADVYGVGRLGVPLWINVAVPLGLCVLVAVAAIVPALRAGRLSAAQALAAGRSPHSGRGYLAHRVLGRLALPRPLTIGLASPFGRPARMAATLVAVLLGVTAVTFAVGLVTSLRRAVADLDLTNTEQIQVQYVGSGGSGQNPPSRVRSASADQHNPIPAALASLHGTARYAREVDGQYVRVSGLVDPISVTAFLGNAGWIYTMSSGHWFTGPGQAVVPRGFLAALHLNVGDSVTVVGANGRGIPVRIVGEVFDHDDQGLMMMTDWRTLTAADPRLRVNRLNTVYDVGLRRGADPGAYAQELAKLGPDYGVPTNQSGGGGAVIAIALAGTLTLLLSIAAGLGVLNTVVLQTRERVHDLAVFKAIGMTPRQTVVMVLCSVAGVGLLAGLLAVPIGIGVHGLVLPAMAAGAGLGVPSSLQNVYGPGELVVLALAGLAIALAGALLPASWAANSRTVSALRAE